MAVISAVVEVAWGVEAVVLVDILSSIGTDVALEISKSLVLYEVVLEKEGATVVVVVLLSNGVGAEVLAHGTNSRILVDDTAGPEVEETSVMEKKVAGMELFKMELVEAELAETESTDMDSIVAGTVERGLAETDIVETFAEIELAEMELDVIELVMAKLV